MAVRLHAAGREQAALRIESLNALRRVDRLADGGDFPVFEEQAAVFQVRPGHGLDICVADQQHRCSPFVRGAHLVSISSITARRASDKCFSFSFQPASC